ncbi:mitochondrial carrier domain-containing protein [Zychaea mexicana]|uniref:mitochondrial carrier domain-containing protein n=1 Tax=Zychaea mexicana TaxID=64656 RepID=UPI0022FF405D|nr:mitochondrial carrier domain-containing protein [Zychaea mexicana]KAI9482585.1 mitochondrial carrier domain-containing protein [Zychaea mexicana]
MHASDAPSPEASGKHLNIPSTRLDANINFPPYFDTIVAGAIGGASGDFMMHSVDTVKTRVQGQPHHRPSKYHNMVQAYRLIWKEEGVLRGLYAGITPAMLGSLPATTLYFSAYEFTKRTLTGYNVPEVVSHLTAGSLGDLLASVFYVPSEVLKTRMQLQGRYNNPHFISGYNYRGTWHATKVIVKYDGFGALFHGFTATILRDVPYSALQFACYEQFKKFAKKQYDGEHLPIGVDLLTGSMAGGLAGAITTPLDLMKTLLQTQQSKKKGGSGSNNPPSSTGPSNNQQMGPKHYSGILEGMMWNYKNHGLGGLFRGVGPRVFWTSLQSAVMFVIYEQILHVEEALRNRGEWPPSEVAAKLLPK